MANPKPSELVGEALAEHLRSYGMAVVDGKTGLVYLSPSGKSFARRNPNVIPLVEAHNHGVLSKHVTGLVKAGFLKFERGRYRFTEGVAATNEKAKRASFSEAQVFKRILEHGKPESLRPRRRR